MPGNVIEHVGALSSGVGSSGCWNAGCQNAEAYTGVTWPQQRGEPAAAIARRLQVCLKTVYNLVEGWTARKDVPADCLADQPRFGRPSKLCDQVAQTVTNLLETKPRDHGSRPSEWTVPLIQKHLAGKQIAGCGTTIRKHLHNLGYRWKRPRFVL